jgi:hypothetical protein
VESGTQVEMTPIKASDNTPAVPSGIVVWFE